MTDRSAQILKSAGLKATPARKTILDAFFAGHKPINAEFILSRFKNRGINQVTIYRTLASFERAAIIKKVDLQKASTYYELAGRHHHHAICTSCGDMEDVSGCIKADLDGDVRARLKNFRSIQSHSLEFFGLCRKCAAK